MAESLAKQMACNNGPNADFKCLTFNLGKGSGIVRANAEQRKMSLKLILESNKADIYFFQECDWKRVSINNKQQFEFSLVSSNFTRTGGKNPVFFNKTKFTQFGVHEYKDKNTDEVRATMCLLEFTKNKYKFAAVSWHAPSKSGIESKIDSNNDFLVWCDELRRSVRLPLLIGGDFNYKLIVTKKTKRIGIGIYEWTKTFADSDANDEIFGQSLSKHCLYIPTQETIRGELHKPRSIDFYVCNNCIELTGVREVIDKLITEKTTSNDSTPGDSHINLGNIFDHLPVVASVKLHNPSTNQKKKNQSSSLEEETNETFLLIHGLREHPEEITVELVTELLKKYGFHSKIISANRIGKPQPTNKIRPIKVGVPDSQKQQVLKIKLTEIAGNGKPIYITECFS